MEGPELLSLLVSFHISFESRTPLVFLPIHFWFWARFSGQQTTIAWSKKKGMIKKCIRNPKQKPKWSFWIITVSKWLSCFQKWCSQSEYSGHQWDSSKKGKPILRNDCLMFLLLLHFGTFFFSDFVQHLHSPSQEMMFFDLDMCQGCNIWRTN